VLGRVAPGHCPRFGLVLATTESTSLRPLGSPVGQAVSLVDPAPTRSLKALAIRGSLWIGAAYGTQQVLRLGGNLVLTRLLFPEAFGLMALVNVVIQCLQTFSDIGIGPSIIQNDRGDDRLFCNTAWTVQMFRGVVLWLCVVGLAHPVAVFYGEPMLTWLLPLAGLSAVIAGFNSTAIFSAQRHLALGRLACLQMASTVVGLSAMVALAAIFRHVWTLVVGGLIIAAARMILSHLVLGGSRNRFRLEMAAVRALISFGKWIFLNTLIGGIALHLDRILMGKLIPLQVLGVYAIARNLSLLPRNLFQRISGSVVFPAIAKRSHLPREELRQRIIRNRWRVLGAVAPFLGLAAGLADIVITTIYDARYWAAGWMTPILLLGLWPAILSATIDKSLLAIGKPRFLLYGTVTRLVFASIAITAGYAWLGALGAVIAVALSEAVRYLGICWGLHANRLLVASQDLLATLGLAGVLAAVVALRLLLSVEFRWP